MEQAELGGLPPAPFNIHVMDVAKFIHAAGCKPVTSSFIQEPSSSEFNHEGLFSEEIFGQLGTEERMTRFGYIELNTTIISPPVFVNLMKLGSFFQDLMAGKVYAVWNKVTKTFDRIIGTPESVPDARTGFSFFMEHYPELEFERSGSISRDTRIDLVTKNRDSGLCAQMLVAPAGLRDISTDAANGRMVLDDVNSLYASLIGYSGSIPRGSRSPLYDPVRWSIQAKAVEIYEYYDNLISGKKGFFQGNYASRRLALGTRNVITAATFNATRPDDPQMLKVDETQVGLFQTLKGFQPLIVYGMRTTFFGPVFGEDGGRTKVPLVDPKTLTLEYVDVDDDTKQRFMSSEGIGDWISRFQNTDVRAKPITVMSKDNKPYYLSLVYDTGSSIFFFRTITDLKTYFPGKIDKSKIRPLTWIEAFYISAYMATVSRHVFITRYPVIADTSCYPSKVHLVTTSPGRIVKVCDLISGGHAVLQLPEYPILGNSYQDSVSCHPSKLAGLGADHDGDMVSVNSVLTDEANAECRNYMSSSKAFLDVQKMFISGGSTDLIDLTFNVLSQPPRPRKK